MYARRLKKDKFTIQNHYLMKKISLLCLTVLFALAAHAQAVTYLSENFNTSCVTTGDHYPAGWSFYNKIPTTVGTPGQWGCGPTDGKGGQPCMECTGYYSTTYNIDTAFLLTPLLDIGGYTGNVYLNFDTKVSYLYTGIEFSVFASADSTSFDTTLSHLQDFTDSVRPFFGVPDSSDWVTHQLNITSLKGTLFYICFRYASPTGYGSIWYLDNINTTTTPLGVKNTANEKLPLTIVGNPTSGNISFSCSIGTADVYDIALYDITGRCISNEKANFSSGTTTHHISNLNLAAGMYFLKVGNEKTYGATKLVVQ